MREGESLAIALQKYADLVAVDTLVQAEDYTDAAIIALALGTASTHATGFFLQTANNLSDLINAGTARSNLGLGTAATHAHTDYDAAGAAAAALIVAEAYTDSSIVALALGTASTHSTAFFLQTANNLSDVTASTARTNLGLGTSATHAATDFENAIAAGTTGQYWRGDKSWQTLDKSAVGLGSVSNALQLVAANNLSDLVSTAAARTNLGVAIGTNVQAYDATLQSISALGTAADKMIYSTATDTWAEAAITSAGRALIDDADASAQRTTLGLGTLATQSGTFSGTSSGTNTGDQTITLTGDVTGSGTGSFAATIAANAVTLAKMATVVTASILGRNTAGTGNVESLTTLPTGVMPAFTGDVTNSAGSLAMTIGPSKVLNSMLAGSIAYSKLSLTGAIVNGDLAGSIAYSKLSLTGAIVNGDLAGSIDLTTKVTGQLPFANGGNAGTAATVGTTGVISVSMTTALVTITPTGACTFNATGGITGQLVTFAILTSGTSSFTLTWGTNYRTTGTLATGTTTAKRFQVTFRCLDGTTWLEIGRTVAT